MLPTLNLDLDRYFRRINYTGASTATLDVLRELHRLQPQAIPFENLNPLTRKPIKLDLASLTEKLIDQTRGGYCFELNTLFAAALIQLGFKVTPLIGRVLWGHAPDTITPRTHMTLRIDLNDEAWLADVGFGSVTLAAPLRLTPGVAQSTSHGTFRLADAAHGALNLEVQTRDTWAPVYRFDLQPVEWIDYETSNWYTSTSPDSIFASNLLVCRVLPEGRLSLMNRQLTERAPDGTARHERQLDTAAQFATCLQDDFGLNTGDIDIADVFERVRSQQPVV
jgi:N-hydroxyarylamine O-acetyltransferase